MCVSRNYHSLDRQLAKNRQRFSMSLSLFLLFIFLMTASDRFQKEQIVPFMRIQLVNFQSILHDLIICILAMIVFLVFFFNDLYGSIDLQRISDMVCLRYTIEMKQS